MGGEPILSEQRPLGNYNNARLYIDPVDVHKLANSDLKAAIEAYAAELNKLVAAWSEVPSYWAGLTEEAVSAFFARYDNLARTLFGEGKETLGQEAVGTAVLPKIAWMVATMAANFDQAESGIVMIFNSFANPPSEAAGGEAPPTPGPIIPGTLPSR